MFKASLYVMVFVASSCFGGCNSPAKPDPVSEYRQFVVGELKRLKEAHTDWTLDDQFKLDVQKTESLVSPLVGTCIVNMRPSVGGDTLPIKWSWTVVLHHGLQNNKWVETAGKATYEGTIIPFDTIDKFFARGT